MSICLNNPFTLKLLVSYFIDTTLKNIRGLKKMQKKMFVGIFLCSLIFLSMFTPVLAVDYTNGLADATGVESESEIKTYDKKLWKKYVSEDDLVDDTFDGDVDKVGAKSKSEILSFKDTKWNIIDVMDALEEDWREDLVDKVNPSLTYGFQLEEDDLEDAEDDAIEAAEIDDKWKVWEGERNGWDFTDDEEFDEKPDDKEEVFPIFQDPKDGEDVAEYIRACAGVVVQAAIIAVGTPVVGAGTAATIAGQVKGQVDLGAALTYTNDMILWYLLVDKGLPMAKPIDDYCKALKKAVDPDDWKYDDENNYWYTELEGEKDYYIYAEVSEDYGAISAIEYRTDKMDDEDGETIWRKEGLAPFIPGYELPVLFVITGLSAIGLIYIVMKKK
jgi:hypothetical protein